MGELHPTVIAIPKLDAFVRLTAHKLGLIEPTSITFVKFDFCQGCAVNVITKCGLAIRILALTAITGSGH